MPSIPTESRIPTESQCFANRNYRAVRRLEALHADRISPGTTTWTAALAALYARLKREGSPVGQAAILRKAITYLCSVKPEDTMHIVFAHSGAARSAVLCFAAFSADEHPLEGVKEEGVSVLQHLIRCDRRGGAAVRNGIPLAYISKHAMGRLDERNCDGLTSAHLTGVFALIGMLGHLARNSEKHIEGGLCLHFGDTLIVGSMRHAVQRTADGQELNGTFYDVRTALPADEVRNRDMIEQGRIANHVVATWLADGLPPAADADRIPFLPRRHDDYVQKSAVKTTLSEFPKTTFIEFGARRLPVAKSTDYLNRIVRRLRLSDSSKVFLSGGRISAASARRTETTSPTRGLAAGRKRLVVLVG
jgi:hypothetical protein